MFAAFDGRRPLTSRNMFSTLAKYAKGMPGMGTKIQNKMMNFRLMYSNKEFHGGKSVLPEPLETVVLLYNDKYKIGMHARKFLDLPGDSKCRGLNGVPLQWPGALSLFVVVVVVVVVIL